MQRSAHESSGVNTVADFGDGAQRSGEPKVLRDDRCEFDRCRRDEPYPLTRVEMALGEGQGARMSLSDISSEKMRSPRSTSSSTRRSLTNDRADAVAEAISSRSSDPLSTNFTCRRPKSTI